MERAREAITDVYFLPVAVLIYTVSDLRAVIRTSEDPCRSAVNTFDFTVYAALIKSRRKAPHKSQ